MSVTWEQQQKRDVNWYKADINKNIALHLNCDYFTMIYDLYCKSIHGKSFRNALEVGISNTGGYLSIIDKISKRIGLDPAVDLLRKMDMLPLSFHIKYVRGFAENMPFSSNFFDLVIISNALDHVKDMKKSVEEIERVIKDGGYVLFATYLRVKKPHPWTWQTAEEARNMFKNFKVIEEHEVKDNRPFFRRSDAYIAILQK